MNPDLGMPSDVRRPRTALGLVSALAVVVAGTALQSSIPLNPDVAWFLIAARRMMAGGTYSADFFEMNMPLAIALYIPPQLMQQLAGMAISAAILLWSSMLILQCLVLVHILGRLSIDRSARVLSSPAGLAWLAFVLTLMPAYDFGQREPLAFALYLPFIVMIAMGELPRQTALRIYISLLAGLGFAIKPHYALLPVLLLSIRSWHLRSLAPFRSLEMLSLLVIALANALLVTLRFPDWFTCARWAVDLYGAYHRDSILDLWVYEPTGSWLPALVIFALAAAASFRGSRLVPMLFCACGYGLVAFMLQSKGWRYQLLPAAAALMAAIPAVWVGGRSPSSPLALLQGRGLALVLAAASIIPVIRAHATTARVSAMPRSSIAAALRPAAPGDYIYCFSTNVEPFLPTIPLMGLNWGSRFSPLWPLAGLAAAIRNGDPRLDEKLDRYAGPLANAINEDFQRYKPSLVIVDRRSSQFGLPPGFDMVGFLLRNPEFRRTWSAYVLAGSSAEYEIFLRTGP